MRIDTVLLFITHHLIVVTVVTPTYLLIVPLLLIERSVFKYQKHNYFKQICWRFCAFSVKINSTTSNWKLMELFYVKQYHNFYKINFFENFVIELYIVFILSICTLNIKLIKCYLLFDIYIYILPIIFKLENG